MDTRQNNGPDTILDADGALAGSEESEAFYRKIADLLQESQELNFKRWDILSKPVHQNFQALGSYDAELQVVKTYVDKRIQSFDELIRK